MSPNRPDFSVRPFLQGHPRWQEPDAPEYATPTEPEQPAVVMVVFLLVVLAVLLALAFASLR